jgi:hypothetical protein
MFKKTKKAKILEDFLSDTRAKNVQVQREGERYKERERGTKRGREVSNLAAMCAFSYVPSKVTTCSLLRICVL